MPFWNTAKMNLKKLQNIWIQSNHEALSASFNFCFGLLFCLPLPKCCYIRSSSCINFINVIVILMFVGVVGHM